MITGLDTGGAELMLLKLLSRIDRAAFSSEVLSLTDIGAVGEQILALGIAVHSLGMRRGVPDPRGILKAASWLRKVQPDVVQTWMYHADLIGSLAMCLGKAVPLAWGIRQSSFDLRKSKRRSRWTAHICARLSHWAPARIVCCSEASYRVHAALGYNVAKMLVIPNGYDLDTFHPDPAAYASVRQELGLAQATILIGVAARFDPQKDHETFVQATALLHAHRPEVHFLLCGDGMTWKNKALAGWIDAAGLRASWHLLGRRADMPRLTAAFDIATLSSAYGEGFPNVLGEAMACGVPCVATDVGDAALIVGETGVIVPPQNPASLAAGWRTMLAVGPERRRQLGEEARRRIASRYSLASVVRAYETLYEALSGCR